MVVTIARMTTNAPMPISGADRERPSGPLSSAGMNGVDGGGGGVGLLPSTGPIAKALEKLRY